MIARTLKAAGRSIPGGVLLMRAAARANLAAGVVPYRVRNAKQALRRVRTHNAALVTIDVFDTALNCKAACPEAVFRIAAGRAAARLKHELDIPAVTKARVSAERLARDIAAARGRREVTLDEIYDNFDFSQSGGTSLVDALRTEEVAAERAACICNPDMLGFYRAVLADNIPVAFIVDTCLDSAVVADFLTASGYDGPHQLFVSSAHNATKADGRLFDVVAEQCHTEADHIWHIGNDARTDVIRPRRADWNPMWYQPVGIRGALS